MAWYLGACLMVVVGIVVYSIADDAEQKEGAAVAQSLPDNLIQSADKAKSFFKTRETADVLLNKKKRSWREEYEELEERTRYRGMGVHYPVHVPVRYPVRYPSYRTRVFRTRFRVRFRSRYRRSW